MRYLLHIKWGRAGGKDNAFLLYLHTIGIYDAAVKLGGKLHRDLGFSRRGRATDNDDRWYIHKQIRQPEK